MASKGFNPLDYFFLLRPLILIPCWDFFLIGAYLAAGKAGSILPLIVPLLVYTFIMAGVYILNQLTDIKTDAVNKKLFLLANGYVSKTAASVEMVLLWAVALALSFRYGPAFIALIVVSLIMGILYSIPPVKLKGKPFLDTLSNGIGYGMINFAAGWLVLGAFRWSIFGYFVPYFLSICAVFINTAIVDMTGDMKAGEITTAVMLKEGRSYVASTVLMAAAAGVALLRRDLVCLIPAALSLPLFAYAAVSYLVRRKVNRTVTIASFRLPGAFFTVMTVIIYPWYGVFLVLLIALMRIYYRTRFAMNYPTLTGG